MAGRPAAYRLRRRIADNPFQLRGNVLLVIMESETMWYALRMIE
jgi:hypothetical protein